MLLRHSALALSRQAVTKPIVRRSFATSVTRQESFLSPITKWFRGGDKDAGKQAGGEAMSTQPEPRLVPFEEVKSEEDLLPPGGEPGTVPTDVEQSTGLERLEILGKMQGVDIFDMRPLDSSRTGTLDDPIIVNSAGDEQLVGCTGCPADSHHVIWLRMTRERPMNRCVECGGVYRMEYIGPPDDPHAHGHGDGHGHGYGDEHQKKEELPKKFAEFVRPEYLGGWAKGL